MSLQEALNLINQICVDFKGTLKDHQMIQQALAVVKENLKKQEVEEVKQADE